VVLFRWYRRLVLLLLLLAALVGASLYLFVFAPTNAPGRADAVVVLSGSVADRIPRALALMRAGTAPVLVVSDGRTEAPRLCGRRAPYRVLCFRPDPYSTRGEAEEIGRLARANGWRRVDVVTSRYHVFRARMLIERCYHGGLRIVASTPSLGRYAYGAAIEWPKLALALTLRRRC
jgi:uncharacterized SAM-binding protein YcdF (DUF218 family)